MKHIQGVQAWVYDHARVRRGILPVLSASAVDRRNDVSTFVVDADTTSPEFHTDMRGWYVRFCDSYGVDLGGVVTSVTHSSDTGVRASSFSCETFETFLQRMITLPSPDRPLQQQDQTGYYTDKGPTEDVIRRLVYSHVGNGAREVNRAGMDVHVSQGRGTRRSLRTRFKNLLEATQNIATNDGALLFETYLKDEGTPTFRFRVPRDLTRQIRLSEINGALGSWELTQTAPETTRVLVAGQGEGKDRTLVLRTGNNNDWGVGNSNRPGLQSTVFQDRRDTDEKDELEQAGDDTLAEGAETAKITTELNDIPGNRYGEDFLVGDKVTVQLMDGLTLSDTVQTATIEYTETGRQVSIHVGETAEDPDENDPKLVKQVRRLANRLNNLEAM